MAQKVSTPVWIGRVISGLVAAAFAASAVMKFVGGERLAEGIAHLGIPDAMVRPLAFLELTCVALYLVPMTSVIGAILLTGYMGGAICTHWRVGDPFFIQIGLGVAVWLGLWLRDARLRTLIPFRTGSK